MDKSFEKPATVCGWRFGYYLVTLTNLFAYPDSAMAAMLPATDGSMPIITLSAIFIAILVFSWAFVVVRKLVSGQAALRQKLKKTEHSLNEAEAIIRAEPGIMILWRGKEEVPQSLSGDMHGIVKIPTSLEDLMNFKRWLEIESAEALSEAFQNLRQTGQAFNIGVRTVGGELLEADGRAAGGMATLRFRPLVGERRHNTDLAYETRRLGRQVQRLSAIIDKAPFPVWLEGPDNKIEWVNTAYMSAVGAARIDDVLAQSIRLINQEKLQSPDEADSLSEKPQRADVIVAGNRRTMNFFHVPLENEQAIFAVDITKLADAQRELDLHIKAHASTLDKLTTAIAIFGPDKNLRFYNAAYARLWQLDTDWLDTHPSDSEILDRLRVSRQLPEQANYRSWKEEILSAYKTIEAKKSWWHLPDGRSIKVIAEQHPFGGVTYLYENETEQISLESRYNALTSIQTETLNNLDEGVALFGSDGKIQLHNFAFARFWNLQEEFLDNQPHIDDIIAKCLPLYADHGVWEDLKYCVTSISDNRNSFSDRISRTDGKVFDCEAIPLPDGNTLVTFLDVSASASNEKALRDRNEALEAADRLKTYFLSNVSYELRTPLTNILGFAESLSMGIAGKLLEKQSEYLGHIQASSNDLLAVIDAILDLTTIDAGAMELHLETLDVAKLLENCARAMSIKIAANNLTLNIEIGADVTTLVGDKTRLIQVFSNLLSNAIGFSPEGSTVQFGAKQEGEEIVIWVADNGRGMEPGFQKRAFDRFQSIPVSNGHRGPGLGLALVKSFVELHEGSVALFSKLEKGTTVICRLPKQGPREYIGDVDADIEHPDIDLAG